MPSASQPASALRDRAERHVFGLLPELPAVERRALALLELAGADRAAAAADTGLDATALRFAAKRARKALRRGSAPLAAGARCERAELLLSDRLDGPLERPDRKWVEIHLARCPRCDEHRDLLDAARTGLRASFVAEPPPALPPAPEPPALEERAKLRVVPEPEPLVDVDRPTADERRPTVAVADAPPAPVPPAPSPAIKRAAKVLAPVNRQAAKRIAVVIAVILAIVAAAAGISALDGDATPSAPWTSPGAPDVRPAPLIDQ